MLKALYTDIQPFAEGKLRVSNIHELHYEEVGNPNGIPALFLHGGPGLGVLPIYRRFFDPEKYRVILLDQRGAGRSRPYAEMEDNNTWSIVADLEKLRTHLSIDKWLVMGGSWGSLLGLCYAIKHPASISGLILRGVFLGRQQDLDWVYSGVGTAKLFPEQWQAFKAPFSDADDKDLVALYNKALHSDAKDSALSHALSWASYGANTMTLLPSSQSSRDMTDKSKMLSLARTECHFAAHKFFLPNDSYILDNIKSVGGFPVHIVHGRYDAICSMQNAWDLHQTLPDSTLHIVADGAHAPTEPGMIDVLVTLTDEFALQQFKQSGS